MKKKWPLVVLPGVQHLLGIVFFTVSSGFVAKAQEIPEYLELDAQKVKQLKHQKLSGESYLIGRAVLDAKSFSEGPTSGQYLGEDPVNGQKLPFVNKQPVQGFSSVYNRDNGTFLAMSDNGFGSIENSADYNLRVYTIEPRFKSWKYGHEDIKVLDFFELNDPDKHILFAITNHFSKERILTGADFDIESFQIAADGTYWFGDEFGPFLIHTDHTGKVLEAPIPLPDFDVAGKEIRSPQNPFNEEASAIRIMNAMRSHAFASKGITPVFSPWEVLLDDNNADTYVGNRKVSPAGLMEAFSEIFKVSSLQSAGFPVIVWTVNNKERMTELMKLKVNGIISDRPDLLLEAAMNYDADNDGQPDFLDKDGLIDIKKFDAQGHRGGRSLRPENTLPAMEAALDYLMTTLETDCGITKDGQPVLSHDPYLQATKVRMSDGSSYDPEDEILIKDITLYQLQTEFIADKILPGRPTQTNNRSLSPVSVAYAKMVGLADAYTIPTLPQLFKFVDYYITYYRSGDGKNHPDAKKRWKNAERVRFNIETKINPRSDEDHHGKIFASRTFEPAVFSKVIGGAITNAKLEKRADIQSFDFSSLLEVQKNFPEIRTVCLFGDFPIYNGDRSDDGTNLQDENGANTPWLAGLFWPYRITKMHTDFKAQQSGGFEGMAYDSETESLYPLLEKPLKGSPAGELLMNTFDIESKKYLNKQYKYQMDPKGSAIGEFNLFAPTKGLIIERDNSQGDMDGFKAIFEINLDPLTGKVKKRLAADLLNISDPLGASWPVMPGDVGLGYNFGFPFVTIESVMFLNSYMIGVLNDNNYPFSIGRHTGSQMPDDNEFIILFLNEKLGRDLEDDDTKGNKVISANDHFKLGVSPNPFRVGTTFEFTVPQNGSFKLTVFNALGQEVKAFNSTVRNSQQFNWDGKDYNGKDVPAGVYYGVLDCNNKVDVVKFVKSE